MRFLCEESSATLGTGCKQTSGTRHPATIGQRILVAPTAAPYPFAGLKAWSWRSSSDTNSSADM